MSALPKGAQIEIDAIMMQTQAHNPGAGRFTLMAIDPHGSLTQLRGVGPQAAQSLAKLGLNSPMDLLLHLPFSLPRSIEGQPIADIQSGTEALIVGQIMSTRVLFGRQRSLEVVVRDDTGELKIRFFHFSKYQHAALDAAATHSSLSAALGFSANN